jgi:hypothetical protein
VRLWALVHENYYQQRSNSYPPILIKKCHSIDLDNDVQIIWHADEHMPMRIYHLLVFSMYITSITTVTLLALWVSSYLLLYNCSDEQRLFEFHSYTKCLPRPNVVEEKQQYGRSCRVLAHTLLVSTSLYRKRPLPSRQ